VYGKLFASLYQGTLRGNADGILVFTCIIAHMDMHGYVDMHDRAIAEAVGIPQDRVRAAILELESPDPESRSPEEGGRRIVRIDEHRAWGWRVVNGPKYRAIRNEEDRREQNRAAQGRWRERSKVQSADVSHSKPRSAEFSHANPKKAHTEAEAEAYKEIVPTALVVRDDSKRNPPCPYEPIKAAYHELCPSLPAVRVDTAIRKKHTGARWTQVCSTEKWGHDEALEWFRWFFAEVERSDFLTGRRSNGSRPWRADFQWLMTAGNFAKVVEGKYRGN
jgi:hypothetical protein